MRHTTLSCRCCGHDDIRAASLVDGCSTPANNARWRTHIPADDGRRRTTLNGLRPTVPLLRSMTRVRRTSTRRDIRAFRNQPSERGHFRAKTASSLCQWKLRLSPVMLMCQHYERRPPSCRSRGDYNATSAAQAYRTRRERSRRQPFCVRV